MTRWAGMLAHVEDRMRGSNLAVECGDAVSHGEVAEIDRDAPGGDDRYRFLTGKAEAR